MLVDAIARIEPWQIDKVCDYLSRALVGVRIDDFPRGHHVAHLFVVTVPGVPGGRTTKYYLLITRQFFERFTDQGSLRQALISAHVAKQLARSGGRTLTLY